MNNHMKIEFDSISANESFARVTVAAFLTQLNPTLEEVSDVKTAVSEAVTNAIVHGYENAIHTITLQTEICDEKIIIKVKDSGKGIENISQAMEPMFTTDKTNERSGMGFTFMEAFMDEVTVESQINKGTTVTMKKKIGSRVTK